MAARKVLTPPLTNGPEDARRFNDNVCRVLNNLVLSIPGDSTAIDVAGVVSDLNDLLAALRVLSAK
jgi:hypothetical protein